MTTVGANGQGPAAEAGGLRTVTRALRHRNFRLFFAGQGVSLIGSWIQWTTMGWLVYDLTGSQRMLGTVNFASQIPAFFLAGIAGALADRWNRRRLVIATQTLAACQAGALAALTLTGAVQPWHIIALGVMIGIVNAFDVPARQSLVIDMLEDRADLPNAIALNSTLFNIARLVGPTIAGALIVLYGSGFCFLVNTVSFSAVIGALLLMRTPIRPPGPAHRHVLAELKDGLAYVWGHKPIRAVLLMIALASLMGMPYAVLMPVFARDVLHGGAQVKALLGSAYANDIAHADALALGLLVASPGVGALAGALFLASRRNVVRMGRMLAFASALFGASLIGFSLSRNLWLSMALLVPAGFGILIQMAGGNTVIQTLVDDDNRGRVMSCWTMAFMGMTPFGALLAGEMAHWLSAPTAVLLGGVVCILGAMALGSRLIPMRVEKPAA